ncbi:uncharacterized protein LOC135480872 [Liolophura sinensis]|uniref:uncharacterized protein LOC135480872 n=1 Tax=Liolophura sinensis TaxID=3198878 RepID=UPI0031598F4B
MHCGKTSQRPLHPLATQERMERNGHVDLSTANKHDAHIIRLRNHVDRKAVLKDVSMCWDGQRRQKIMPKETDKLPVIDTGICTRHSQPSRRQGPKLAKDQLTSNKGVRFSPCLPPLTNPGSQRKTRQTTLEIRQGKGPKLAKGQLTPNTGLQPSICLTNSESQREFRQTTLDIRQGKGNIDHFGRAMQLKELKEKLLTEIERETELKSSQTEDERYLNHLRKNLTDLVQETEGTMRETMEISAKSNEVRETLTYMRRQIADLQARQTRITCNSERLQDAYVKLEDELTREIPDVMKILCRNVSNKVDVSRVQNRFASFVEQRKVVQQKASASIIRDAAKTQPQAGVPHDKGKITSKTKGLFHKLTARILGGRKKRHDGDVNASRSESPVQYIRRTSKKLIGRFKGRNQITPIPKED